MKRGQLSEKVRDGMLERAQQRGLVQLFQHRKGNVCDLSILSPGLVSLISVVRLIRLSSTPDEILYEFAGVIGRLRFIASSPAISRELWLRTPRGAWRFFRVLDDGIAELDRYGMPLANAGVPAGTGSASGMVIPVPALRAGADDGSNGPAPAGTIFKNAAGPVAPDRIRADEPMPLSCPVPGPAPGNDPPRVLTAHGPEAAEGREYGLCDESGTPEKPACSEYPGLNPGLLKMFMRWREEKRNTRTEPGKTPSGSTGSLPGDCCRNGKTPF